MLWGVEIGMVPHHQRSRGLNRETSTINGEHKPASSLTLWIPILWFFFSAIRGTVFPGPENPAYAEGHPFPVILAGLMILGTIVLFARRFDLIGFIKNNKLVVLLFCLMGVSILWSFYPWISFKRWIKTIGTLEMVLIILSERDPSAALSFVLKQFFYLVIPVSLFLVFFVPSVGIRVYPGEGSSWVGLFLNRNNFAKPAMIFALFFVWLITKRDHQKNKVWNCLLFFLSVWVLLGTGSATAFIGVLFGLGVFVIIAMTRAKIRQMGVILLYIFLFGGLSFLLADTVFFQGSLLPRIAGVFGRDATLTGRTELWADLWEIILLRPILGQGYGGFWVEGHPLLEKLWERHLWFPMTAHNGYLSVLLELGVLGLGILILLIFTAYTRISRALATDYEFARLRMAFFCTLLVQNISESSMINLSDPLWALFLLSVIFLPSGGLLPLKRCPEATGRPKPFPAHSFPFSKGKDEIHRQLQN